MYLYHLFRFRSSLLVAAALSLAGAGCGDNNKVTPKPDAAPPVDGGPHVIPIDRAHAGGLPSAVVLANGSAYVGVGPRLAIWRLDAVHGATLVGESAPLRGIVQALAVAGDRAYVSERISLDAKLHVFDISNPAAPVETKVLDLAQPGGTSVITALAAAGGKLYVADQEQGVIELDLANPDDPTFVRIVPPLGVTNLAISGSRLYYWSPGFIGGVSAGALDLDNALAPLGGSGLGNMKGLMVTGDLAIGAGADGIHVYDLADPSNPVERFSFAVPEGGPFARTVAASGTAAWIPANDGLHVLDLTTPTAIVRTGPLAMPSVGARSASTSGGLVAFTTDRGQMLILDVAADPIPSAKPEVVDVTLCADCLGIAVDGSTLHVADFAGGVRTGGLAKLDDLGGRSPQPAGNVGADGISIVFEDVQVAGNLAYVADWWYGLRIYDVSNPAKILEVGSLDTPGAPSGVAIAGERVYLAEGTDNGALRVIDVTNPQAPVELGAIGTSKAIDVEVHNGIAYVADESNLERGGLKIFDVSNPAQIVKLGAYDTDCADARDVALVGALAIVACSGNGFHVVDVSNPAAPTRRSVVPVPGISSAWSSATWKGHAALGHDKGVVVVDLADPAAPVEIAAYATSWAVRTIAIPTAGRILAASGLGGVYQWQITDVERRTGLTER